MESNPNNLFVLTILIQMHGKVMNFDLTTRESNIFKNVRLLCKAGDFIDYETTRADEFSLVTGLQEYFTHDLAESTYEILKKARSGVLVDNITYDKSLSVIVGEPTLFDRLDPVTYIQGIYLLSIHKDRKLIYPDKDKKVINLLKLSDLQSLANMFDTRVPDIENLSTIIPSQRIYIEEENTIKNDNNISEEDKEERIKQIRQQFYNNLYNWQLTLEGNKIVSIKLSTLVELVKTIIEKPCFINILDYSCNSPTIYIPKEQTILKQYALKEGDIEMGIKKMVSEGGKKNHYKRIKKQKKLRTNKRRNKYKSKKNNKSKKRLNRYVS